MKTFLNLILIVGLSLFMSGCFAEKTYLGKVNVVGVGAGQKAAVEDTHYVDASQLSNVVVAHATSVQAKEQDVSDTTKYVAGDALTKVYSGEPKLLVDYLNAYQSLENKVLILDKNGVVAWSGNFKTSNIQDAQGVYDYGITGVDRMSFAEAMEKFVLDLDVTDYDEDKVITFPQDNSDSFMSGFSYSKKYPLLFTKLPDMMLVGSDGNTFSVSSVINNSKPTVLVLYMSQADSRSMMDDVSDVKNVVGMFMGSSDSSGHDVSPAQVLESIEEIYFTK